MSFAIRLAEGGDVPVLRSLIAASVLALQAEDYSQAQLQGGLDAVYGVDTQLISDGTYFVVETQAFSTSLTNPDEREKLLIVGCGGWSKRRTLYGGDQFAAREDDLLDPLIDAAKIRAFFVHPEWARRGIGSLILDTCEGAAAAEGFTRLEMGATLTGVRFYSVRGYVEVDQLSLPLSNGESLPITKMEKHLGPIGNAPDANTTP